MDLETLIKNLQKERSALDEIMVSLVELQPSVTEHLQRLKKGRGRTSMGAEERRAVAERIRKYWAMKRQTLASDPEKRD
jgi:hypothetical protein